MSYAATNTQSGFNVSARLRGAAAEIKAAFARRAEYRRTFNELDSLTARELADIGLRRADIAAVAREHAYGK